VTTRKAAIVPSKGQWLTEKVYDFARNDIARDMIGSRDFMRFVPFLFALFVFILLNNLFGIIPPFQNPTMARVAFPIALTLVVYVVYNWIGFKKHGAVGHFTFMLPSGLPGWIQPFILPPGMISFFSTRPLTPALVVYVVYHWIGFKKHGAVGYFKFMLPSGLPGWIKPFILLLEMITFFITRPLTLALRLFGNMFAGHMLLVVFIVGGWVMFESGFLHEGGNPVIGVLAIPAWLMGALLTAFEGLIQFLQAYVFVLLAASYIGGALVDEH